MKRTNPLEHRWTMPIRFEERQIARTLIGEEVMVIRTHLIRALESVLPLPDALMLSHREHTAIVEALVKHDGPGARQSIQTHLKAALLHYRRSVQQGGQQKS